MEAPSLGSARCRYMLAPLCPSTTHAQYVPPAGQLARSRPVLSPSYSKPPRTPTHTRTGQRTVRQEAVERCIYAQIRHFHAARALLGLAAPTAATVPSSRRVAALSEPPARRARHEVRRQELLPGRAFSSRAQRNMNPRDQEHGSAPISPPR